MKKGMFGKFVLLYRIPLFLCIFVLLSCNKKVHLNSSNYDERLSDTTILNNWSLANSGRWFPYNVKNVGDRGYIGNLDSISLAFRPINSAKYYYKTILQRRLNYSEEQINNFLKKYYYSNHRAIDQRLVYRKSLDSLYADYSKLTMAFKNNRKLKKQFQYADINNVSEQNNYYTNFYNKSYGSNKYEYPVFNNVECLPKDLIYWFVDNCHQNFAIQVPDGMSERQKIINFITHFESTNTSPNNQFRTITNTLFKGLLGFRLIKSDSTNSYSLKPMN